MKTTSRALALTLLTTLSTLPLLLGAAATAAPARGAPRLFSYAGGESVGAGIHSTADARRLLKGTGGAFKRYIGGLADALAADPTCAAADYSGITVEVMRTDGYAAGGVNCAGGYAALWAVVDGSWKQIAGTQDAWDCRVLRKRDVPSDVAGDSCYAYHGDHRTHAYHHA